MPARIHHQLFYAFLFPSRRVERLTGRVERLTGRVDGRGQWHFKMPGEGPPRGGCDTPQSSNPKRTQRNAKVMVGCTETGVRVMMELGRTKRSFPPQATGIPHARKGRFKRRNECWLTIGSSRILVSAWTSQRRGVAKHGMICFTTPSRLRIQLDDYVSRREALVDFNQ